MVHLMGRPLKLFLQMASEIVSHFPSMPHVIAIDPGRQAVATLRKEMAAQTMTFSGQYLYITLGHY